MSGSGAAGKDWTDQEIDLIVADYFLMLGDELAHRSYVKLHHNKSLQALTGRSHRSIEFKHQNISAVLRELGMPWIIGYLPKPHYQRALLAGIDRYLAQAVTASIPNSVKPSELAEPPPLYIGPAPSPKICSASDPPELRRLLRKFDPAKRDARNRTLGEQGEDRVFHSERTRLAQAGREDLARGVRWVSKEDGDGAGYDIRSFTSQGEERFLEVKTTNGYERTPFYVSANEVSFSEECPDRFRIVRLYDFAREPKAFKIKPPLIDSLILETANYRASFG